MMKTRKKAIKIKDSVELMWNDLKSAVENAANGILGSLENQNS